MLQKSTVRLRRDRGRLRRLRRVGGQAAQRGRPEGRARGRGPPARRERVPGAHARRSVSTYRNRTPELLRRTRPIQQGAGCDEFNYKWFANDLEEPYTTPSGKPFTWLGRLRADRRADERVGSAELPASATWTSRRPPSTGSARTGRSATRTSSPTTTSSRTTSGISGLAEGLDELPDSRFLPAHGPDLRGDAAAQAGEGPLGLDGHPRPRGRPDPAQGQARALPLLRSLPARLRGPRLLQLRLHHRRRRPGHRQLHAHPERHGLQGADGYGHATGRTGVLYIDRETREPREVHAKAVVLCAQALESVRILLNSANRQHPGGLGNSSGVLGRYLMDHIWVGGGARGRVPRPRRTPSLDGPNRPNGIYVTRFRNTRKARHARVPARVRLPGRRVDHLPLEGARLRRGVQAGRAAARHHHRPRRLRRVPALRGQLRGDRHRAWWTPTGSPCCGSA